MDETLDSGLIPRNVLLGKKRGFTSVASVYKVHLTQKLLELINSSFWARSEEGGEDDLRNKWKKLAPRTIDDKTRLMENGEGTPQQRHDYRWGRDYNAAVAAGRKQSRGGVTATQRATFDSMYKTEYRKAQRTMTDARARKAAEKAAWGRFLTASKARVRSSEIPINIRTGRLVAATAPGTAVYNRYTPPSSDQVVRVEDDWIEIDLGNVPYAAAVDAVRPIIPDNCQPWIKEAHAFALKFAELEYKRLLEGEKSQQQIDKAKEKRRIRKFLDDNEVPF